MKPTLEDVYYYVRDTYPHASVHNQVGKIIVLIPVNDIFAKIYIRSHLEVTMALDISVTHETVKAALDFQAELKEHYGVW